MLVFERVKKDAQLTVEEHQGLVMKGSVVSLKGYLICGSAFGRGGLKRSNVRNQVICFVKLVHFPRQE